MFKRFLKKSFLFFLPLILGLIFVEIYLQYYPSTFQLKASYINSHKKNIEILILGSSHNQVAINPAYFSKHNASNLAFGGQDLQIDSELLDAFIPVLPNLKYVLFELGYHSLENLKSDDAYNRNNLYLRFYGINNFGRRAYLTDRSIFLSNPHLYLSYLNPFGVNTPVNKYGFATELSSFEKEAHRFESAHFDPEIINKDTSNKFLTRHKYENLDLYKKNSIIFEEMITQCVNHNIVPIIIIPPVYLTYQNAMLQDKKQRRDDFIKYCMAKYSSILLFDYENSHDFLITDFSNEDHLDPDGAKKFTIKIDSLINSINYTSNHHTN